MNQTEGTVQTNLIFELLINKIQIFNVQLEVLNSKKMFSKYAKVSKKLKLMLLL